MLNEEWGIKNSEWRKGKGEVLKKRINSFESNKLNSLNTNNTPNLTLDGEIHDWF